MSQETNESRLIDEIDRLSITHDKAKNYLTSIMSQLDEQINLWKQRQRAVLDNSSQMKFSPLFDTFVAKTERIGELTLQVTESLSRVNILMEQIARIDPKSFTSALPLSTSISTRAATTNVLSSNYQHETDLLYKPHEDFSTRRLIGRRPTEKYPFRTQPGQSSTSQQQPTNFENSRWSLTSPSVYNTQYNANDKSYPTDQTPMPIGIRRSHLDPIKSSLTGNSNSFNRQQTQGKVQIPFQSIRPGTRWKEAEIDCIDSLSGFYVRNADKKVQEEFLFMHNELTDDYSELERKNMLKPLENPSPGDFGVAKFSADNIWYRARLIKFVNSDEIFIVYVDYGNGERKSVKEFFPIDEKFTRIPIQAIGCTLSEAFPKSDGKPIWSDETVQKFSDVVTNKTVEVQFNQRDDEIKQWPLHFVKILVDNQSVTNFLSLKQFIDLRPNSFIASQLSATLSEDEKLLFNIPPNDDEHDP